jgi:hypothetical protein
MGDADCESFTQVLNFSPNAVRLCGILRQSLYIAHSLPHRADARQNVSVVMPHPP